MAGKGHTNLDQLLSLSVLNSIKQAFIRPWGKHNGYTFYTVNETNQLNSTSKIIFNLSINEARQEASLVDSNESNVVISQGGLQRMTEPMYFTSLEAPRLSAEINNCTLIDNSEENDAAQLRWSMDELPNSIELCANTAIGITTKRYRVKNNEHFIDFIGDFKTSTVSIIYTQSPFDAWKRTIALMGAVKLLYCAYQMHKHPMPNGIPHLMPLGVAFPPNINSLQSIVNVKFRISCRNTKGLSILDLLDELSNEILLVVTVKFSEDDIHYVFRDIYGECQFYAVDNCLFKKGTLVSGIGNTIGHMDYKQWQLAAENGKPLYENKSIANLLDPHSPNRDYALRYPGTTTSIVKYHRDEFDQVHVTSLAALPNEHKALAIHNGARLAFTVYRICNENCIPNVERYLFRLSELNMVVFQC